MSLVEVKKLILISVLTHMRLFDGFWELAFVGQIQKIFLWQFFWGNPEKSIHGLGWLETRPSPLWVWLGP